MQTKRRMIWKEKNVSPREAGVRILDWFERVFHPLHHGIELVPVRGGVGNGQDIHHAPSAGEHHLFIINLISAITADNEPGAATRLIGDLLITSSVGDHPTLKMFWRRIVLLVPGTDEKLSVDIIGSGMSFDTLFYRVKSEPDYGQSVGLTLHADHGSGN